MLPKVQLIVLHRFPYGDSSWILKALSAEHGIISLLTKGAKRKESPYRGTLDPISESQVVLHPSRSELFMVRDASLVNWYPTLRNNLVQQAEAMTMAEVILRFAPQGIPLPQEFSLLQYYLQKFEQSSPKESFLSEFLLEISKIWGFHFNIQECGICGTPLSMPPVNFEEETGNVFCRHCSSREPKGRRKEYLEDLFRLSQKQMPINLDQTESGILHYLKKHLGFPGKELHSFSWLKETRKLCLHQKTSS